MFSQNIQNGILITGPESSGKSYLTKKLSSHYKAPIVEEYARQYLVGKINYSQADLTQIAEGQIQAEQKVNNQLFFADTGVEVIHIWSQEKFGNIRPELKQLLNLNQYQLVLLCKPNIPWEPDPLRENPLDRDHLFQQYINFLKNYRKPFKVIDAKLERRVSQAISLVEASLTSQNQKP